ncbi:MAG: hypothetical protein OHK0056_31190 [Bacteriovoracaceae bacterium]
MREVGTIKEELVRYLGKAIRERVLAFLDAGVERRKLDELREFLGDEYIDLIEGVIGGASGRFLVRCSVGKKDLIEYKSEYIPKEIEREIRRQIKKSSVFNIDYVVFCSRICQGRDLNYKTIEALYLIYQGMGKRQGQLDRDMYVISYIADMIVYCQKHDLDFQNIILKPMHEFKHVMKGITHALSLMFILTGKEMNLLLNHKINELLYKQEEIDLQELTAMQMMFEVPWIKRESYFKGYEYQEREIELTRLCDVFSIAMTGIQMKNCLHEFDHATKYLDKRWEIFLVKTEEEEALFEIEILKKKIVLIDAYKKCNEDVSIELKERICNVLQGIVRDEKFSQYVDEDSFFIERDECDDGPAFDDLVSSDAEAALMPASVSDARASMNPEEMLKKLEDMLGGSLSDAFVDDDDDDGQEDLITLKNEVPTQELIMRSGPNLFTNEVIQKFDCTYQERSNFERLQALGREFARRPELPLLSGRFLRRR